MAALLPRVKSRLFIHANRRSTNLLDGAYSSIQTGRSLDFDDLREYVAGDEVDDIDWKATARTGSPLVKRYLQSRRQNVMLVVDTGRGMAATAEGGESKSEIAIDIAGVLGFLSLRHGDSVGMVSRSGGRIHTRPPRASEGYLESLLRAIQSEASVDAEASDVTELVEHGARILRSRGIVVIIADDLMPPDDLDDVLKRMSARHEVIWITVADVDLIRGDGSGRAILGVDDDELIPAMLRSNRKLQRIYASATDWRISEQKRFFTKLGISYARIAHTDQVVLALLHLLRRRSHVGF